jgi:non-canonical (house-cleaning) NTP pyrophosphatase
MAEVWDDEMREGFMLGLEAGLKEAAHTLREAATNNLAEAAGARKVAVSAGHRFAADLLNSYANGFDMRADNVRGPIVTVEPS